MNEELEQILARLEAIERRLDRLEGRRESAPEMPPPPRPPAAPPPPVPPFAPPPPRARTPRFEAKAGLALVNRAGVVTLLLGLAFFFKYAVESDWIGETGRVALGLLAGVAALAIADRMWRGGQRIFANGVTGLGLGVLYLAVYAASAFYHLVPHAFAFAAMSAVTVLAGALAMRYGAQAIAALGLFGGFATPLLLESGRDATWLFFAYLLLLDGGARWLARKRGWIRLEYLAATATLVLAVAWFQAPANASRRLAGTIFAAGAWAMFAIDTVAPVAFAARLLAPLAWAALWEATIWPGAVLLPVALAANLLPGYRTGAVAVATAAYWWAVSAWMPSAATESGQVWVSLTAALLMALAWPGWRSVPVRPVDLAALGLHAIVYYAVSYNVLDPSYKDWRAPLALATGLVFLGAARWWRAAAERHAMLAAALAWGFVTLAIPMRFEGYQTTVLWAAEAAALAWIASRYRERRVWYASAAVLVFVLLRLLGDASLYGNPADYMAVFNARMLAFAAAAAAFWAVARWTPEPRTAAAVYTIGHLVMLWAIGLEVSGWAARNATPAEFASVQTAGISIGAAVYALMLAGIGVATRTAIHRYLALALIALVVVKLYAYDVWLLRRFYRITAFAALGALLLSVSYLYSRFRGRGGEAE